MEGQGIVILGTGFGKYLVDIKDKATAIKTNRITGMNLNKGHLLCLIIITLGCSVFSGIKSIMWLNLPVCQGN